MAETTRPPLSRERVLLAAVALADAEGVEAASMRRLADTLGVVPMALYKHVANKDALLDGMVDVVLLEVPPPVADTGWRATLRARVLAARVIMLRHPWARRVMEAQAAPTPVVLSYMDATIGILLAGGLAVPLVHHVMHTLGSRIFGFSQELYETAPQPSLPPEVAMQLAAAFPHIAATASGARHDAGTVVAGGCDDDFEFGFSLDLLLDGIERLHAAGWLPPTAS